MDSDKYKYQIVKEMRDYGKVLPVRAIAARLQERGIDLKSEAVDRLVQQVVSESSNILHYRRQNSTGYVSIGIDIDAYIQNYENLVNRTISPATPILPSANMLSDEVLLSLLITNEDGVLVNKEDEQREYKIIYDGSSKKAVANYIKTMAAFYNNNGGYLVYGVDDKTRDLVGLNDEFVEPENLEIHRHVEKYFDIAIQFTSRTFILSGKKLFIIYVEKRKSHPTVCKIDFAGVLNQSIIYYRYNAESKQIRPGELKQILYGQNISNPTTELRITADEYSSFIAGESSPELHMTLGLKIVNVGITTLFIERPTIEVANEDGESFQLMAIAKDFSNRITQYPYELKPSEPHSETYIKTDILNYIATIVTLKPLTKFRFCVEDTLEIKHFSPWKEITGY